MKTGETGNRTRDGSPLLRACTMACCSLGRSVIMAYGRWGRGYA